jgi:hypothetical protein
VLEVAPNGSVVWSVEVALPHEAERLGTGDESTGGPSAIRADLDSRRVEGANRGVLRSVLPTKVFNGLTSILPNWIGIVGAALVLTLFGTIVVWAVLEAWWSSYRLRLPIGRE